MKVVILAGGKGIRMSQLTVNTPKPLCEVGGMPILWHIMKIYNQYGLDDFMFLLGYKGEKIKEYFVDYIWKRSSFLLDMESSNIDIYSKPEPWKISFIDTGVETMTGGRIKKAEKYIGNETFMLTYGDGLADINISELLEFHKKQGKIATVTGIYKKSQYGILTVDNGLAKSFEEKKNTEEIINGGFFVFEPEIFNYLDDDSGCVLEQNPLKKLVEDNELSVYIHDGFWTAMDTLNDINNVNKLWNEGKAVWKTW
ncbi:glucose-1-phosphate cytidylyltransferase [Clostridium butyricum]|uniref:glucose-1-phosphate cytidylyltransferase n=1 Tax=Clostridium butyricum TaxID=1492 RepID=UPI001CA97BDB|nr:glucose-1-phosphate cytidylyltransferase [Clostridium butyricum]MBZ0312761.1 glucose-1-phosphate cytidylyltransferase [Clostridium butyricum]